MLSYFKVPVGWGELLKRTGQEAINDDLMSLSAQQAYYFLFALFPALLALIAFASFFPIENLADRMVDTMAPLAPPDVIRIIEEQMLQISRQRAGGLLTFAFVVAIWTSSTAMVALSNTLNKAYGITESRPWYIVRLISMGLTLGLALFILVSMALVIGGPAFAERLVAETRLGEAFKWTWWVLQWPVVFLLVTTAIGLVYYFAPDAEQEWVWITPGSVLATGIWLVVSLGLKYYLASFGDWTETYGAIGAVMVLMLWFWLSGLAILIGAELNAEIEHASPHGKDVGEKRPGEKRKLGPLAARLYEEKRRSGQPEARPFAEGVNCDLDRLAAGPAEPEVRPSDILMGAAALLPFVVKAGRDLRKGPEAPEGDGQTTSRGAF